MSSSDFTNLPFADLSTLIPMRLVRAHLGHITARRVRQLVSEGKLPPSILVGGRALWREIDVLELRLKREREWRTFSSRLVAGKPLVRAGGRRPGLRQAPTLDIPMADRWRR